MIRPDRKEQIDKTIARELKLGEATFPFILTPEELRYYRLEMGWLERRADRIVMLMILSETLAALGLIVLGCWAWV